MAQSDVIEDLREVLTNRKVIPVLGSGFSTQVAGLPNWPNLILRGASFAENNGLCSPAEAQEVALKVGSQKYLDAADLIQQFLQAPGGLYPKWLGHEFGRAQRQRRDLYDEVVLMDAPFIATTNYDRLVSKSFLYPQVLTWRDSQTALNYIKKKEHFVFHLHGVFDQPSSVIFGNYDYQQVLKEPSNQALMNQLWTDHTFLFIGTSLDGLLDPHFSDLVQFFSDHFSEVDHTHYILLRKGELDPAQIRSLVAMKFMPVYYGHTYDDLPKFVTSLNPNRQATVKKLTRHKSEINRLLEHTARYEKPSEKVIIDTSAAIDSDLYQEIYDMFHDLETEKGKRKSNFEFVKNSVNRFLSIQEITRHISQWSHNSLNPEIVTHQYIQFAVLCSKALQLFPKEILQEIRKKKPHVIHHQWFSGDLDQFVNEYEQLYVNLTAAELRIRLEGDNYYFENLRRIMSSCRGVLELSASDIYGESGQARLLDKVPTEPLVLVTADNFISIRLRDHPDVILAELPCEPNLAFQFSAVQYLGSGKFLILAATQSTLLLWDPYADQFPKVVFNSDEFTPQSINLYAKQDETHIYFTLGAIIIDLSHADAESFDLPSGRIESFHLCRSKRMALFFNGITFNTWDLDEDPQTVLHRKETEKQLKALPEYQLIQKGANRHALHESYEVTFIEKEGEFLAMIRAKFIGGGYYSILLVYRLEGNQFNYLGHYSVDGIAFKYDFIIRGSQLRLAIGLLATSDAKDLIHLCAIDLHTTENQRTFQTEKQYFKKRTNGDDDILHISLGEDLIVGNTSEDQFIINWRSDEILISHVDDPYQKGKSADLAQLDLLQPH